MLTHDLHPVVDDITAYQRCYWLSEIPKHPLQVSAAMAVWDAFVHNNYERAKRVYFLYQAMVN